jgi:hypothetical protein
VSRGVFEQKQRIQPRHPKGTTRAKSGKGLAASQSLGRLRSQ